MADIPFMGVEPRLDGGVARRIGALVLALVSCGLWTAGFASNSVETGVVAGQVRVVAKSSRRLISAGAYPGRTVGLAAEHDPSELANVVVFVKSPPVASPPMKAVVTQSHEEFVPHLVAITAGSTVQFPNEDLIFHNVFSLSRSSVFDLGRYAKGKSRSWTFQRPGLVKVFCHLHSHMSALIRVFDHPHFAIPDADGRFAIPNVPAGRHEVVAWHERAGEVALATLVSPGGTTDMSFSLPLTDKD